MGYLDDDLLLLFSFYYELWVNILGKFLIQYSVFKLQKRIIRIIMDAGTKDSCREVFKILKVLPLRSQYILSLVLSVVNNKKYFKINSEIHSINTRNNSNLFKRLSHSSVYQNGRYYFVIKVHTRLTCQIKDLSHDIKQFK